MNNWLGGLEEGEEIHGFRVVSDIGPQGRLTRRKGWTSCPNNIPNSFSIDCIDNALDEAVEMIKFGLAASDCPLEIVPEEVAEETEEYERRFHDGVDGWLEDKKDQFDNRQRFNSGALATNYFIRYIVRRRQDD